MRSIESSMSLWATHLASPQFPRTLRSLNCEVRGELCRPRDRERLPRTTLLRNPMLPEKYAWGAPKANISPLSAKLYFLTKVKGSPWSGLSDCSLKHTSSVFLSQDLCTCCSFYMFPLNLPIVTSISSFRPQLQRHPSQALPDNLSSVTSIFPVPSYPVILG